MRTRKFTDYKICAVKHYLDTHKTQEINKTLFY